jgi:hypothetical protein
MKSLAERLGCFLFRSLSKLGVHEQFTDNKRFVKRLAKYNFHRITRK